MFLLNAAGERASRVSPGIRLSPSDIDIGGLFIEWRQLTVCLNHSSSFGCVFFTHEDDRSADAGKRILDRGDRFQVRLNACRFEQSLDDERFGFLLGIENLDEFLVGSGLRRAVQLCHASSTGLAVNRLRQSLCLCLAGHRVYGQGQLDSWVEGATMAVW